MWWFNWLIYNTGPFTHWSNILDWWPQLFISNSSFRCLRFLILHWRRHNLQYYCYPWYLRSVYIFHKSWYTLKNCFMVFVVKQRFWHFLVACCSENTCFLWLCNNLSIIYSYNQMRVFQRVRNNNNNTWLDISCIIVYGWQRCLIFNNKQVYSELKNLLIIWHNLLYGSRIF